MLAAVDQSEIARIFRQESGRAIASLIRRFGDIDLAEEAVQEAFAAAVTRWPAEGLPGSPAGWIITTARNRAIDRLRRESTRDERQLQSERLREGDPGPDEVHTVEDDRLRLIFTCCHPALSVNAQVALTLRLIAGLQTGEIARAFLVAEPTMSQRLTRAKRKIRAANIPYRVPRDAEMPSRLRSVLAVVYLVFNEGHVAASGDQLIRRELCDEAIRLARLVVQLMPDEPEALGLLGLLLLTHARRPARVDADGAIVRLADQDRARWEPALIAEGHDIVRACLRRNTPGPYQIQAAIAAVHADAPSAQHTDWAQIVALYDQLLDLADTPVVVMNRAIALAEVAGPAEALAELDGLDLGGYHLFQATRGDLLARLGRQREAADAFAQAVDLTSNAAERALLTRRRDDAMAAHHGSGASNSAPS